MPRTKRGWIAEEVGAYHLISRVAGGDLIFGDEEKEYFVKLLEQYAAGFYVDIHTFCIMGNHFHILATGSEVRAQAASSDELCRRYRAVYGDRDIPGGTYQSNGDIEYDDDGGVERLRARLGSISRFMQELKQSFSRWYNKKHKRKGYLWGDRFKGVLVAKGQSMLACSAYIDLNPVRAGIVTNPEEYRFSSMGMRVRDSYRAHKFVHFFEVDGVLAKEVDMFYRQFVFESGGVTVLKGTSIPESIVDRVKMAKGRLGLGDALKFRCANFSEGLALGSKAFIKNLQEEWGRTFIRQRRLGGEGGEGVFVTRVLS